MEQFSQKYRKYAFGALVVLTLSLSLWILAPFFPALMWAVVLAVLVSPIYKRWKPRLGENGAATAATFGTIALVGVPLLLIGLMLTLQVSEYVGKLAGDPNQPHEAWTIQRGLTELDKQVKPLAERLGAPDFSVSKWYDKNGQELTQNLGRGAVAGVKEGGYAVLTLVIAFLTLFFLLRDGHRLRDPALELLPVSHEKGEEILGKMANTIRAVFVGVILVSVVQGSLAGLAYWIAGVPSPFVWFVATVVLCAIPLLGAPIVYIPMSLLLVAQGKPVNGVLLLLFGFGVVSQIDNILRPFVIGARTNLHPMAIFFSLLGGVLALGPVGIMAGPVLLTVLLALQEILREQLRDDPAPPLAEA